MLQNIICCPQETGAARRTITFGELMHVVCAMWNKDIDNNIEPYAFNKQLLNQEVCGCAQQKDKEAYFIVRLAFCVKSQRDFVSPVKNLIAKRKLNKETENNQAQISTVPFTLRVLLITD